jgi:hypothetical protein
MLVYQRVSIPWGLSLGIAPRNPILHPSPIYRVSEVDAVGARLGEDGSDEVGEARVLGEWLSWLSGFWAESWDTQWEFQDPKMEVR